MLGGAKPSAGDIIGLLSGGSGKKSKNCHGRDAE